MSFPHLPRGREPGLQSLRNRTRGGFIAWLVLVVGTGMYAAGVWVAAGGRGSRFDRQEELLGGLFLVGMGLVSVYVGLSMWEKRRPRRHPRLRGATLALEGGPVRRGEELSVTFTRGRTTEGLLEVGLACDELFDIEVPMYVKGASAVMRETSDETAYEHWQPVAAGAAEQTVTFEVPADAPYSYEGECVSFAWRVSVRAVKSLQEDPRLDQPTWVEP